MAGLQGQPVQPGLREVRSDASYTTLKGVATVNILRITQISRYNPLCSVGKVGDTEVSKTVCSRRSAFPTLIIALLRTLRGDLLGRGASSPVLMQRVAAPGRSR